MESHKVGIYSVSNLLYYLYGHTLSLTGEDKGELSRAQGKRPWTCSHTKMSPVLIDGDMRDAARYDARLFSTRYLYARLRRAVLPLGIPHFLICCNGTLVG